MSEIQNYVIILLIISVSSSTSLKTPAHDSINTDNQHGSQVVAVGTPLPTASLPLGAQQGPVMVCTKFICVAYIVLQ